jgi:hypothetical protein
MEHPPPNAIIQCQNGFGSEFLHDVFTAAAAAEA